MDPRATRHVQAPPVLPTDQRTLHARLWSHRQRELSWRARAASVSKRADANASSRPTAATASKRSANANPSKRGLWPEGQERAWRTRRKKPTVRRLHT